jgi:hypothetical protein
MQVSWFTFDTDLPRILVRGSWRIGGRCYRWSPRMDREGSGIGGTCQRARPGSDLRHRGDGVRRQAAVITITNGGKNKIIDDDKHVQAINIRSMGDLLGKGERGRIE